MAQQAFPNPLTGLSGDLAIWRNLWSDGEDLARHARTFIANHLTAADAS